MNSLTAPQFDSNPSALITRPLENNLGGNIQVATNGATSRGFFARYFPQFSQSRPVTDPNQLLSDLVRQTVELRESNVQLAALFTKIKELIETDAELRTALGKAVETTGEILLPPPKVNNTTPVSNSIVEDWRIEMQKKNYYESLKTRFNDLMEKNPDFLNLFKKKYSAILEPTSTSRLTGMSLLLPQQVSTLSVSTSSESNQVSTTQEQHAQTSIPKTAISETPLARNKARVNSSTTSSKCALDEEYHSLLKSLNETSEKPLQTLLILREIIVSDFKLKNRFSSWLEPPLESEQASTSDININDECRQAIEKFYLYSLKIDAFLAIVREDHSIRRKFMKKLDEVSEQNGTIIKLLLKENGIKRIHKKQHSTVKIEDVNHE